MNPHEAPPALPPVARRLAWLHFWNDFSLDCVTPLLPVGVGAAWLGLMEGIADAAGQALRLVSGRASDRSGKRVPWVRLGYGANAFFRPLAAVGMFVVWPWWIVMCRIGDRIGKGLRGSASDALLADWVTAEARPRAFALMRTYDHVGATCGALFGAAAAYVVGEYLHWNIGWVIAALVLPMLVTFVLGARLQDAPDVVPKPMGGTPMPPSNGWWPRDPALRWPLAVIALAAIGAKVSPLLVLAQVSGWAGDSANTVWKPWQLCLGWAALNLVQTLASAAAVWAVDRLGTQRFLQVGWLIGAVVFAGLATLSGSWLMAAGLAWGIVAGLTEGAEKAWIAHCAPKHERATAFGALSLLMAGSALIGSGVCGFGLSTHAIGSSVFWLPAGMLVIGALGAMRRT